MKKLMAIAVVVALLLTLGSGLVLAAPPGVGDGDTVGQVSHGKTTFTKLENKDISGGTWAAIVGDGIWGWVQQRSTMNGDNAGNLHVRGLIPDTWYMVTLWAPAGTTSLASLGNGLFGGKTDGAMDWTDVALFKTDSIGDGDTALPSAGGLVATGTTPGLNGYVPGINTSPTLARGNYPGVHVDLKNVGTSTDGTAPSMAKLMNPGGAGDAIVGGPRGEVERWLFEWAPLNFTLK